MFGPRLTLGTRFLPWIWDHTRLAADHQHQPLREDVDLLAIRCDHDTVEVPPFVRGGDGFTTAPEAASITKKLPALATYRCRPSGAKVMPRGSLPTGIVVVTTDPDAMSITESGDGEKTALVRGLVRYRCRPFGATARLPVIAGK